MAYLYEQAEAALLERQKLPGDFGSEAIKPSYDGLGLVNVPALALQLLGVRGEEGTAPALNPDLYGVPEVAAAFRALVARGPVNHVIILLMDALGYDQLLNQFGQGKAPNLYAAAQNPRNFFAPLTSVFPSTTTTALTAVATARTPQEHGIMGTTTYFPNIGMAVNLIGYRPAYDYGSTVNEKLLNPDTIVPVPNIFRALEQQQVRTQQVNYYQFENSSISRFCSVGSQGKYIGYSTPAGAFTALREVIESVPENGSQKSYTYAYVSTIDGTAHTYGPLSPTYEAELAVLDFSLQNEILGRVNRPDTLLMMIADHGQMLGQKDKILWIHEHPELVKLMSAPVGGDWRATYLYLKNGVGVLEKAKSYCEAKFSDCFKVLTRAEALAAGLLGNPESPATLESLERTGDLILCGLDNWQTRQFVRSDDKWTGPLGIHAGLSRTEMLIPFLAMRLG